MDNRKGDDLDDDFVPDDLVALSGEEDDDFPSAEDGRDFLSAEEDDQMRSGSALGSTSDDKKRKRREKDKQRKAKVSFLTFPAHQPEHLRRVHLETKACSSGKSRRTSLYCCPISRNISGISGCCSDEDIFQDVSN